MVATDELKAKVLAKTAVLMATRLRAPTDGGTFQNPGAGTPLTMFTAETKPTLTQATTAASSNAGKVARNYPLATAADEDSVVSIAALLTALELEGSNHPEQVASDRSPARLWLELLKTERQALEDQLGGEGGADPDQDGVPGMAAVWGFGSDLDHVPGSECPQPISCDASRRRLRW